MGQDFKCFFGLHRYEVYKEEYMVDVKGNTIGKIIICRCTNCGRIKNYAIFTCRNNLI